MHKIDTIYKVKISFTSDFIGGATSEHQHDRKGYGDDDDGGDDQGSTWEKKKKL